MCGTEGLHPIEEVDGMRAKDQSRELGWVAGSRVKNEGRGNGGYSRPEKRMKAKWEVWDRCSWSQIALNHQERKLLPLVSF